MNRIEFIAQKIEEKGRTKESWSRTAHFTAAKIVRNYNGDIVADLEAGIKIRKIGDVMKKKILNFAKEFDEMPVKREVDVPMQNELYKISGIGPVAVKKFAAQGIHTIADLEAAIEQGLVSNGQIKMGVKIYKHTQHKRVARADVERIAAPYIKAVESFGCKIEICGSYRRGKATSGDIDVLITCNSRTLRRKIVDHVLAMEETTHVLENGLKKSSFISDHVHVDFYFTDENRHGAGLLFLTGSAEFNKHCRVAAIKKGLKLSRLGITNRESGTLVSAASERELLEILGLGWVDPVNR